MTFTAIALGSALFCAGFVGHVLWWRYWRPRDDIRALVTSLFVLPTALATGLYAGGIIPALTARETLGAALVILAIGATYIMYYPAAQAASPTMLMVLKIAQSGATGIKRADLLGAFDEELLCKRGIELLGHERFAEERNGKFQVAPRGAFLLRMLNLWRGALGLSRGQG